MEKEKIYEKLETLKNDYLAMEKKYRQYAKCVEQYELFLRRLNTFIYRLLVDKDYDVIDNEAYFKDGQEFNLEVLAKDFSIDLCEIINDLLSQTEIGSLSIKPSEDNRQTFVLTVKFNHLQKIKEVEKILNSLRDEEKEIVKR